MCSFYFLQDRTLHVVRLFTELRLPRVVKYSLVSALATSSAFLLVEIPKEIYPFCDLVKVISTMKVTAFVWGKESVTYEEVNVIYGVVNGICGVESVTYGQENEIYEENENVDKENDAWGAVDVRLFPYPRLGHAKVRLYHVLEVNPAMLLEEVEAQTSTALQLYFHQFGPLTCTRLPLMLHLYLKTLHMPFLEKLGFFYLSQYQISLLYQIFQIFRRGVLLVCYG